MNISDLSQLTRRNVPAFPGWWAALGPGVVWMALAQGSGELIWWPYMVAKYGLTFLWLLAPFPRIYSFASRFRDFFVAVDECVIFVVWRICLSGWHRNG
jgi:hypothetical protein